MISVSPEPVLIGRRHERHALDRLLESARAGESRVLVLRGESGVGKSALLGDMARRTPGCRVARAAGVESETELAYAGLHQLCAPMLDLRERLPAPHRDALAAAFGLNAEPTPDRFFVGLAVLGLLSEIARERPLVCMIDDAQWLDQASAQIIGFVARRLQGERVALVCAARTGMGDAVLAGLPELTLGGISDRDARSLLLGNVYGPLDAAVCDQIIAESHGNPRTLLELPHSWNAAHLAGGFGLPGSGALPCKIEQSYNRRINLLPLETRLVVIAAAAEPLGDPVLLHRAADVLGVDMATAQAAVDARLITIGRRVEFAHPLARYAAYRSATAEDRRRVHHALAYATDGDKHPDRRAWHRAQATRGPNEELAAELERSAGRAGARGGLAAAAAFLERAAALTPDPTRRGERALAAAQSSLQAGAFDAALGLVAIAETGPLVEFQRARVDLLRARVTFANGHSSDAPALLLKAARRLEPLDLDLARETYLTAWGAAALAEDLAARDVLLEVGCAVRALPSRLSPPRPLDLLLEGLALLITEGHTLAVPSLQRAAQALADMSVDDVVRWGWVAGGASSVLWDDKTWHATVTRQLQIVRDAGALAELPIHLAYVAMVVMSAGDFAGAASLIGEADKVAAATASDVPSYALLRLRALQGREREVSAAITSAIEQFGGQGTTAARAHSAAAVLYNGLARYEEAASAARQASSDPFNWWSICVLPELVEAAAREGDAELAWDALERLAKTTQPCGTDLALGIEARCRALLSDGEAADELYLEAIERLSRTRFRPELARAHLLYGEWLRRENRRVGSREQLRTAHEMLAGIGMEAFAERARKELLATGEKVRKRTVETRDDLTAQERQIARLARDGLSNPEIGARLFLSPRTVEWHLRNVFTKLDIRSRRELASVLPGSDAQLVPA